MFKWKCKIPHITYVPEMDEFMEKGEQAATDRRATQLANWGLLQELSEKMQGASEGRYRMLQKRVDKEMLRIENIMLDENFAMCWYLLFDR